MCKQSILYKEGRCSASPALARNFNGSLHLYSKEFSFMREQLKDISIFTPKFVHFRRKNFKKTKMASEATRGHSRPKVETIEYI